MGSLDSGKFNEINAWIMRAAIGIASYLIISKLQSIEAHIQRTDERHSLLLNRIERHETAIAVNNQRLLSLEAIINRK